jgi:hypothetical protein
LGREGGGGGEGHGGQKAVETHGLEHLAAKIRVSPEAGAGLGLGERRNSSVELRAIF